MQTCLNRSHGSHELTRLLHPRREAATGKEAHRQGIHLSSAGKSIPSWPSNCAAIPENSARERALRSREGLIHRSGQESEGSLCRGGQGHNLSGRDRRYAHVTQAETPQGPAGTPVLPGWQPEAGRSGRQVIVATNKDLESEVKKGGFREDLFYRIHVIPVFLPPLRERKKDHPVFVDHFLNKCNQQMKKEVKNLTPMACKS